MYPIASLSTALPIVAPILSIVTVVELMGLQHSILKRVVLRVHAHRRALTSHTTQDVPQLLEEQREIVRQHASL